MIKNDKKHSGTRKNDFRNLHISISTATFINVDDSRVATENSNTEMCCDKVVDRKEKLLLKKEKHKLSEKNKQLNLTSWIEL